MGPAPAELSSLFFDRTPGTPFYSPVGCPECNGTGYRGLVGVFELFEPDEMMSQAIGEGVPVEELRKIALESALRGSYSINVARTLQVLVEFKLANVRAGARGR